MSGKYREFSLITHLLFPVFNAFVSEPLLTLEGLPLSELATFQR